MAKYLFIASYNSDGARGLLATGGTKRRDQIAEVIEGTGGTMECFYFAFGEADAYVICDLPDMATASAISLVVNAAGAAKVRTRVI